MPFDQAQVQEQQQQQLQVQVQAQAQGQLQVYRYVNSSHELVASNILPIIQSVALEIPQGKRLRDELLLDQVRLTKPAIDHRERQRAKIKGEIIAKESFIREQLKSLLMMYEKGRRLDELKKEDLAVLKKLKRCVARKGVVSAVKAQQVNSRLNESLLRESEAYHNSVAEEEYPSDDDIDEVVNTLNEVDLT